MFPEHLTSADLSCFVSLFSSSVQIFSVIYGLLACTNFTSNIFIFIWVCKYITSSAYMNIRRTCSVLKSLRNRSNFWTSYKQTALNLRVVSLWAEPGPEPATTCKHEVNMISRFSSTMNLQQHKGLFRKPKPTLNDSYSKLFVKLKKPSKIRHLAFTAITKWVRVVQTFRMWRLKEVVFLGMLALTGNSFTQRVSAGGAFWPHYHLWRGFTDPQPHWHPGSKTSDSNSLRPPAARPAVIRKWNVFTSRKFVPMWRLLILSGTRNMKEIKS